MIVLSFYRRIFIFTNVPIIEKQTSTFRLMSVFRPCNADFMCFQKYFLIRTRQTSRPFLCIYSDPRRTSPPDLFGQRPRRPPAAGAITEEEHDRAEQPVDDHRGENADRAVVQPQRQHQTQPDAEGQHRRDRNNHRKPRVAGRAQRVRQREGGGPQQHRAAVVDAGQDPRERDRLGRKRIQAQRQRQRQQNQRVDADREQIGNPHQPPRIPARLRAAARAHAPADDGNHRQIHRLPGDAAERAQAVGHAVRRDLHHAEEGDDAQDHNPPELENAVFQTVRQTDAENFPQNLPVEYEFLTERYVNHVFAVGQQHQQQRHRGQPREQAAQRRAGGAHVHPVDKQRVGADIDDIGQQAAVHRHLRVAHRAEQRRAAAIHADDGIRKRGNPKIDRRRGHHLRLDLAEQQPDDRLAQRQTDAHNRQRDQQRGDNDLSGRLPRALFPPRAEELRRHHRAAGGEGGENIDDQRVDVVDERNAAHHRVAQRRDHHRVGHADGDGQRLLENQRQNQPFQRRAVKQRRLIRRRLPQTAQETHPLPKLLSLLAAQRVHRVLARGDARRDMPAEHRQQRADDDQQQRVQRLQNRDVLQLGHVVDQRVDRKGKRPRDHDAQNAREHAENTGLGVKHAGDVLLPRAERLENADLLRPLEHRGVGDDADHNQTHHQTHRGEGDEHEGDAVDDAARHLRNRGGQIGVNDLLLNRPALVVRVKVLEQAVLALEIVGIEEDHIRNPAAAEHGERLLLLLLGQRLKRENAFVRGLLVGDDLRGKAVGQNLLHQLLAVTDAGVQQADGRRFLQPHHAADAQGDVVLVFVQRLVIAVGYIHALLGLAVIVVVEHHAVLLADDLVVADLAAAVRVEAERVEQRFVQPVAGIDDEHDVVLAGRIRTREQVVILLEIALAAALWVGRKPDHPHAHHVGHRAGRFRRRQPERDRHDRAVFVGERVHIRQIRAADRRAERRVDGVDIIDIVLRDDVFMDKAALGRIVQQYMVGVGELLGQRRVEAVRVHHVLHLQLLRRRRDVNGELGQRVGLELVDLHLKAGGQAQNQRDADDADARSEAGQKGAPLLRAQILERQRKRGEKAHARLFQRKALRPVLRRAGVAVGGDAAVGEADDAVGVFLGQRGVVRDHNHQPVGGQRADQLHNLHARLRVERAGRLVAEQDFGVVGQRAGDGHALHLPAGKLVGLLVQMLLEPHLLEHLDGAPVLLLARDARQRHPQLDVGHDRQMRDEVIALKHEADRVVAVGVPLALLEVLRALALDDQLAVVVAVQPADDVEEGRLARAAFAQHGDELLLAEGNGDAVYGARLQLAHAVHLSDVFQF